MKVLTLILFVVYLLSLSEARDGDTSNNTSYLINFYIYLFIKL